MTDSTATTAVPIHSTTPAIVAAARWFWWIAGLSVVNTVIHASGGGINFVLGLAITEVSDAAFHATPMLGYAVDLLAVGFFFAMGWSGQRGALWAFVLGAVVYLLDGLIYLRYEVWMSAGFHALALYYILRGANELRKARAAGA
jgi:hypothetical protein